MAIERIVEYKFGDGYRLTKGEHLYILDICGKLINFSQEDLNDLYEIIGEVLDKRELPQVIKLAGEQEIPTRTPASRPAPIDPEAKQFMI